MLERLNLDQILLGSALRGCLQSIPDLGPAVEFGLDFLGLRLGHANDAEKAVPAFRQSVREIELLSLGAVILPFVFGVDPENFGSRQENDVARNLHLKPTFPPPNGGDRMDSSERRVTNGSLSGSR